EKLGAKKIGFLYQNDAYGKDGLAGCKQRLKAYNMTLVEEVPVEPSEKDLSSQLLRLKNSGAEVVFMWVNPTTAVITLKTSATIGFKPQWFSSDTLSDYPLMDTLTGGLWEGVITGAFGMPPLSDHPLMVKYREAVKRFAAYAKERYRDCVDIDGVRFTDKDAWGLVRPSNTQPVIVLRFEAKNSHELSAIEGDTRKRLEEIVRELSGGR
ncbi:MAG TPA: ABC transporter substrate-binding protein, partial [Deltaproteobacteria bacterium]|nr:ABC transporter substrate-binding protein [Deltaproteobacteria bacterium]